MSTWCTKVHSTSKQVLSAREEEQCFGWKRVQLLPRLQPQRLFFPCLTNLMQRLGWSLAQDGFPSTAVLPLTPCGHLPTLNRSHISSSLLFILGASAFGTFSRISCWDCCCWSSSNLFRSSTLLNETRGLLLCTSGVPDPDALRYGSLLPAFDRDMEGLTGLLSSWHDLHSNMVPRRGGSLPNLGTSSLQSWEPWKHRKQCRAGCFVCLWNSRLNLVVGANEKV